ncbi:DUF4240 domain-containing protein [Nonomuraea endophytica]|uniref:DUF4240 domain-containing protein n=1 Tax=Nonomuraea endophytica TaxID=714136 RepID=A0A7W8AE64_9ACTN|nr:DUF4240 domain-containing protein [Nonomuraea endophytica]MBB5084524.1 hypothetical protein [Nonomuraea endophytica]
MDIDAFWDLIERSAHESETKQERLRWLHERLVTRPAEEIADFASWMQEARLKADTNLVWGAAYELDLVGGLDSVWYFQMWLVGLGRQTFERVTSDPDSLAEVPAVQHYLYLQSNRIPRTDEDWPEFEELDYVAGKAWIRVTGKDWDALADILQARGYVLNGLPSPTDEDWDPDDPEESARRFPRCTSYMRQLYGRA